MQNRLQPQLLQTGARGGLAGGMLRRGPYLGLLWVPWLSPWHWWKQRPSPLCTTALPAASRPALQPWDFLPRYYGAVPARSGTAGPGGLWRELGAAASTRDSASLGSIPAPRPAPSLLPARLHPRSPPLLCSATGEAPLNKGFRRLRCGGPCLSLPRSHHGRDPAATSTGAASPEPRLLMHLLCLRAAPRTLPRYRFGLLN